MRLFVAPWGAGVRCAGRGLRGRLAAAAALLLVLSATSCRETAPAPSPAPAQNPTAAPLARPAPPPPPPRPFARVVFPTDQAGLLDAAPDAVFQPTAAGNIQSAMFGSVRTGGSGQASFHEGLDIAATKRDRRGRPLDRVYAVADGSVGYANRASGNSNYGLYVVLLHPDPVGPVYTLYAHLSQIEASVVPGRSVAAGQVLGMVGNTPSTIVPLARAHLHFEVGLINNSRFAQWFRLQKLKPDHGQFNGWNLLATDGYRFFQGQRARGAAFGFQDCLAAVPQAFSLVVATPTAPDFFARYPTLWQGASYHGRGLVLACSENGLPLSGRNATDDERARLGSARAAVLAADATALGRNGARLVVRRGEAWAIGPGGERWLGILLF